MRLSGKTAIITGGYRGLGLSIVKAYLREGARVAICGRSLENLKSLDESLQAYKDRYLWSQCDITVSLEVSNFVKKVIYEFGSVDILINNAAIFGSNTCIADYDPKLFRNVMEVNLMGSLNMSQCVLPHMIEQDYGKLIHITGSLNISGDIHGGAYYVSKIALSGFSDILASEYSDTRITSNLINPEGLIEDGNIHFFNNGDESEKVTPEEIQDLFVFLASAESNGINGKTYKACDWVREQRTKNAEKNADNLPSTKPVSFDSNQPVNSQSNLYSPLGSNPITSIDPSLSDSESKSADSPGGFFSKQELSKENNDPDKEMLTKTGTLGAPDSRERGPATDINDSNSKSTPSLQIRPEEEDPQKSTDGGTLGAPDSRDRGPITKKEGP
tara:strand:- start:2335 stop:3495 length:1161 start_codon:yes stop_codon:yes gene_type:complete